MDIPSEPLRKRYLTGMMYIIDIVLFNKFQTDENYFFK